MVKILLLPLSLLYGLVVSIRNFLYNKGFLQTTEFSMPIISVGNLTNGGTGKTPHIEYLARLLKNTKHVATLSRGYGRKTKGFLVAQQGCTTEEIGDEPMQYFRKFDDVLVTVGEKRVKATERIIDQYPDTDVILLDDAFQHRAIKPGLSILLTDYSRIFTNNFLMPTGTLRECVSSMKRADIIVVSKSPALLSPLERRRIEGEIKPKAHQCLFFSYLKYGELLPSWETEKTLAIAKEYYFERNYAILLVTGIANPASIENYLKERTRSVTLLQFPDHHQYTHKDLENIQQAYDSIRNPNKIIITTEKDAMRFNKPELREAIDALKIFYLPIEVAFHEGDAERFNHLVVDYVRSYEVGYQRSVIRELNPKINFNNNQRPLIQKFGIF